MNSFLKIAPGSSAVTPEPARSPISNESSNLDLLRSIAVLLVLFGHVAYFFNRFHLGPLDLYRLGGLGVLLFFVHTCLVLMLSLERQTAKNGNSRIVVPFLVRRFFRIYPLSVFCVLCVAAFQLPLLHMEPGRFIGASITRKVVFANLLLVQNYIGPGATLGSILGPMWSLAYEVDMYLLLPWIYFLLRSNRLTWRVCALWLFSTLFAYFTLRWYPSLTFWHFVPCFLSGVVAYQFGRTIEKRLPAFLWPLVVSALVFSYLVGGVSSWKSWILCLLLGIAIPFFRQLSNHWLTKSCHLVAKYSYGIYLSHFFCIWFAFVRLSSWPSPARAFFFVFLVISISVLLYHFIEEPLIRIGRRVAGNYERHMAELGKTGKTSLT